jgi:hypothetical protein
MRCGRSSTRPCTRRQSESATVGLRMRCRGPDAVRPRSARSASGHVPGSRSAPRPAGGVSAGQLDLPRVAVETAPAPEGDAAGNCDAEVPLRGERFLTGRSPTGVPGSRRPGPDTGSGPSHRSSNTVARPRRSALRLRIVGRPSGTPSGSRARIGSSVSPPSCGYATSRLLVALGSPWPGGAPVEPCGGVLAAPERLRTPAAAGKRTGGDATAAWAGNLENGAPSVSRRSGRRRIRRGPASDFPGRTAAVRQRPEHHTVRCTACGHILVSLSRHAGTFPLPTDGQCGLLHQPVGSDPAERGAVAVALGDRRRSRTRRHARGHRRGAGRISPAVCC